MAGRIDAVPGYPLKTTGLSGKPLGTGTPLARTAVVDPAVELTNEQNVGTFDELGANRRGG